MPVPPDNFSKLTVPATVLVDGTLCPTWDWGHIPDLFSAKDGIRG